MMPSPDIFPVPLIHISETNSTNNYLQSLCSKQKVEELTVVVADFRSWTTRQLLGIRFR